MDLFKIRIVDVGLRLFSKTCYFLMLPEFACNGLFLTLMLDRSVVSVRHVIRLVLKVRGDSQAYFNLLYHSL